MVRVKLSSDGSPAEFKKRMRIFCKGRLESYKIPQKVELVDHLVFGERFKKMRRENRNLPFNTLKKNHRVNFHDVATV